MERCYWEGSGRYQEFHNEMVEMMPMVGLTGNEGMDAFILASRLYYDVYNNDGCNLKQSDGFGGLIGSVRGRMQQLHESGVISMRWDTKDETLRRNLKNPEKLERLMDEVLKNAGAA